MARICSVGCVFAYLSLMVQRSSTRLVQRYPCLSVIFTYMSDKLQAPKSFFRSSRYILFWLSSLFSNMGTWMQQVAQPWVILSLNNSPFWVGVDSFAMNAPGWIFTLWGGVLADRFDRKKTILFFQAIQFLCVSTMILLLVMGWLKIWMIVLISFLIGLTDSLSMPSFQSIIPSIVDKKDIHQAISLNSTQFNFSRILGPAIAGVIIVKYGAVACFSANAVSYLPFFLSLYFIYPKSKIKREPIEAKPIQQFKEFRKLLSNPDVHFPLMKTLFTGIFCAPIVAFCAVLIKNGFHKEVETYGASMGALGIGGLIGATLSFITLPQTWKLNKVASVASILLGIIILLVSLNQSFILLIILLILAGAGLTASNIAVNSFLQENTTNNFRGRIVSFFQLALSGGISIGALLTGFTVSRFGISNAFFFNGTLAILIQSFLLWRQMRVPVAQEIAK